MLEYVLCCTCELTNSTKSCRSDACLLMHSGAHTPVMESSVPTLDGTAFESPEGGVYAHKAQHMCAYHLLNHMPTAKNAGASSLGVVCCLCVCLSLLWLSLRFGLACLLHTISLLPTEIKITEAWGWCVALGVVCIYNTHIHNPTQLLCISSLCCPTELLHCEVVVTLAAFKITEGGWCVALGVVCIA